jgi:hypothetical protein
MGPLMCAAAAACQSPCLCAACVSDTMLYTASASSASAKRSMSLHDNRAAQVCKPVEQAERCGDDSTLCMHIQPLPAQ